MSCRGAMVMRWILSMIVMTTTVSAEESMKILTYPTGLVVGELEVAIDLGEQNEPAELFLDGEKACSVSVESRLCTVDLGPDPHVHLLELVRPDGTRVERWVNRPGQEAELTVSSLPPGGEWCEADISWTHPQQLDPTELEVTLAGAQPEVAPNGRSARFPCPESGRSQVLVAMAVFPDGRRVEAVEVVGGFADETSVELTAVPLVNDSQAACETGAAGWPASAEKLEQSGFEVVFVLDPEAHYVLLRNSGWNLGRMSSGSKASTRAFDQVVRSGSKDSEPEPKNSWLKAKTTIFDAERLWYVAPDEGLHRVNGFGQGRPRWLDLLFKFGLADVPGQPRIADAVAASGLVAAAGPRRRAVVLVLGNNVHQRDGSRFSPQQARQYLAEVNVPLLVLRNGKPREDGWPTGLPALNMEAMSRSLRTVRDVLDAQCIGWFSRLGQPGQLASRLPEGVRLAGLTEDAPTSSESVWARAEVEVAESLPLAAGLTADRLDITAVSVVVSARNPGRGGQPVSDLAAEDFEVFEDGAAVTVLGLAPVASRDEAPIELLEQPDIAVPAPPPAAETKDLPVAIYVNRTVGGGFDQRQALRAVQGQIERLSVLGPVEVVVAEKEQVRTLAGPTRDLSEITAALDELAGRKSGQHAIESIRRRFIQDIRQIPNRFNTNNTGISKTIGSRIAFAARASAGEEHIIVSRSLDQLRFWAQRETGQRAGLLVLVGAGFDEDPLHFYSSFVEKLEPQNVFALREHLRELKKEGSVNNLGRELASTGWRILAVAGQTTGATTAGADSRTDKFQSFLTSSSDTVHAVDSAYLLLDPIDAQRNLAEPSGGDVVVGPAGLDRALDQATGWYVLTYQVARPPDGARHALELKPRRPGIELATTRWINAATSEGQAEARVRRLLGGAAEQGELGLDLAVGQATVDGKHFTAEVEAMVHFGDLAPLVRPGTPLRVTIAVASAGDVPGVEHRQEQLQAESAGWIYSFPIRWPAQDASQLTVTVEDVGSGLWGSALVDLPEGI